MSEGISDRRDNLSRIGYSNKAGDEPFNCRSDSTSSPTTDTCLGKGVIDEVLDISGEITLEWCTH